MDVRYRFRIYPTEEQEVQIRKNFGCVRFVYNYFLSKRIERYKAGKGIYGFNEACKDLTALKNTEGYEWLREADSHSLQRAIKNMDSAYTAFFRKLRQKEGSLGFPRFKKKSESRQSYTSSRNGNSICFAQNAIKLPKLGLVECKISKIIVGRILSASVIRVPSGKYYVSVCFTNFEPTRFPLTGRAAGLHFGIRALAVSSDGEVFENPRFLEKSRKKISQLQRRLSRKQSDGANREKARIALAKAYERVAQSRTDMLQKLTTRLVREYDILCIVEHDIPKLLKPPFSFYLSDAAWGELAQLLQYKCDWYGKRLVKISANFPCVQLCSECGYKNAELTKRKSQTWVCPKCGAEHDRAHNAAKNILAEGLNLLENSNGTDGQSET